ncbi:hypothetical protein EGW08_009642 [Elysia chlorotica]|uniref:Uncharacterized protein n=1 Tax=Elysia chlorotica TaxID=188477 RepID=A0A433TM07_ELYCH|nr:hypothetical protein EGW08_009642 [Elysia chlorotica]
MDMEVCATAQSSQTRINNEKTDTASEKSHQHRESCPTAKDVYTTSTAATAKSKSVGMKKQSSTAGSVGNRKQSSTAGSGGNKTQTSAVGINAQISGRTIRSSCESALLSPLEDEEYLEPEVPVRAAAEKLLRELKTKITLMFPNRDIQKEISYDLHKLVKQRSSNVASNDIETAIPFTDTLLFTVGDCCSQPKSMVNSTLSAFRSTVRDCSKTNMTGPSLRLADTVHPHLSERNSTQLSREKNYGFSSREDQDSFNACLWAPSVVMKDCGSAEPIIRINTTSSNRSSDSSEDEDELGGLTAARCDAFIAESRDLERQQHEKRQKQWQAEHDFKLISTNSPSRTVFNDLDSTWIGRQSSKQQSISKLCNCRNSHVHSLNEKSRPPDYNQHVLNSTSNNQTSFSWMDVSPCVADKLPALSFVSSSNRQSSSAALAGSAASWEASTWQQSKSGLSSHSSSAIPRQNLLHQLPLERHASFDSNSATNGLLLLKQDTHDHRFVGGYDKPGYRSFHSLNHPSSRSEGNRFSLSCGRKHRTFPAFGSSCDCFPNIPVMPQCQRATSISTWNNSNDLGSQIIQSRQNFQSALHSACKDSGLDVSLKESGEAMDQDDIFLVRQSEAGSPWINYGGVHTHQVDMQRQARDFLDDLERSEPSHDVSGAFAGPLGIHQALL